MAITSDVEPRPAAKEVAAHHGEVFTRPWVVELILDLCGYTVESDLTTTTLLDPATGSGAFLGVALERLLDAREKYHDDQPWSRLDNALIAFDIQPRHVTECRRMVTERLCARGCPTATAERLARRWIRQADFLLDERIAVPVDFIVGNPPYVRIEELPPATLSAYRQACSTMTGRADIYIGFFEKALELLRPDGRLGFICADRWMRNQYGRALRAKIVDGFSVDACLTMHDVAAFEKDVSAYPAITILRRGEQNSAVTGDANADFDAPAAIRFAEWATNSESEATFDAPSVTAARLPRWHTTAESWPEGSPATLAWLEDLDDRLPLLEDESTGTLIRIGVATGADAVYVSRNANAAEPERMLRLAMSADIKRGTFDWSGNYLVNPWDESGLVKLEDWPKLGSYLQRHGAAVRSRAIAKNNKERWYRTIDRVTLSILNRPKLLMEDLKAKASPVLAPGGYYPHHNLYYVVSDEWDLEVLGGLLLSDVVERQVAAYCVKMRGRTLRFQAQYLRRVRVPKLKTLEPEILRALKTAFRERDRDAATAAALRAFELDAIPL